MPRSPSDSWTLLLNSAQSLLGLDDYFDWYWREGLRARLRLWLPGRTALEAGLRDEDHSSLAETTTFNLLAATGGRGRIPPSRRAGCARWRPASSGAAPTGPSG